MRTFRLIVLSALFFAVSLCLAPAQVDHKGSTDKRNAWKNISSLFSPPDKDVMGAYRSPLLGF